VLAALKPELTEHIRSLVAGQETNYGGSINLPRPGHPNDDSICDQWTSKPIPNMGPVVSGYTSTMHDQIEMPDLIKDVMGDVCVEGYRGYVQPAGTTTVNMTAARRSAAIHAVMQQP